jgi:hypothetical protein
MVSKCANPECSETFKYLHQGKIFRLCPTPEAEVVAGTLDPSLYERFWLCDKCSKEMKLIWDGTQIRFTALPREKIQAEAPPLRTDSDQKLRRRRPRVRAASAGREDR